MPQELHLRVAGPVHGKRGTVQENDDHRLSRSRNLLQHLFLRRRELDIGPVSTRETLDVDRHLLAFDFGRQAHHRNHQIGVLCGIDNALQENACRWLPI